MKLLRTKSMIRYSPPKGTAGLARSRVRGKSRSPAPPASKTPSVSLIAVQPNFRPDSCPEIPYQGQKAPTPIPANPPGTLNLQTLPRGEEYHSLLNPAAPLTLSKIAAQRQNRSRR